MGNRAFYNVSSDIPVFVPGGSVQSYKNANGWSGFTNYHVNGNDTPVIFTDPIVFADTRVKSICVTNWDGNGDGELSYAEATAVTDISTVFRNKTYITSFDELQFFYRLSSIKDYAFSGCNKLTSIKFPNTVTSFGSSVFANCSKLTQIVMEEGNALFDSRDNCNAIIKTSDNQLIIGCKNTVIPNSVTSIGESAFDRCDGLNSIVIPNSVTSIGLFAFSNCTNLVAIEIPHSVVTMDKRAFFSCSGLSQIVVEEGNSVFDSRGNCNAIIRTSDNQLMIGCKNTTIPNSVTSIGDYAFQDCTGLTSVEIPNSVTSIGADAFFNCINIASMTIMAETPPNIFYYSYYVFYNVPKTIPVYVPCGSIEAYQAADKWNEFTNYRGIGSYSITVSATPLGSGSVTGGGYYCLGLPCTLTATEDIGGFAFASWTENGTVVSTDAIYTFTVTGARNLVANYTYQGSGGAIDGVFPVSENTYVNFAQGNLQYQPSTNRWRFAEHQWDLLVTPEDMNYLIEDYNIYVAVVDSL